MEDSVKGLTERLGNAINQLLSESKEIAATLKEIKQTGYKVSLTVEVTIREDKGTQGNDEAVLIGLPSGE